ncbi:AraC family transcriptional regulator [Subtercola boreus]|uniref:AraC family transcriptional regulator n=1 Tax=Subtercola boreus TaxID=120213 RepID=UPI00114E5286|nr:AraC family transcriptional regulator [Subtercola boreus]TQL53897.1 AraC family transcriptional regulator [Subtercola boreus]
MGDIEVAGTTGSGIQAPSLLVQTGVVDEALFVGGQVYHPHTLRLLDRSRPFSMKLQAAAVGPITFGWLEYSSEVHIETRELGTAYQINVPVIGSLAMTFGDRAAIGNPRRAVIHGPNRPTTVRGWSQPTRMLGLKIERTAVEQELTAIIGRDLDGPITFADALDLDDTVAREWWMLVQLLVHRLRYPDSLARHDIMAESITQGVIRGLLLAAQHDYSDEIPGTDRVTAESRAVRRAVDFIRENVALPITLAQIAAYANVGVRSLQLGFQQVMRTTPTTYLRDVRMQRAREELLESQPGDNQIAEIAAKWGFAHPGRFAVNYASTFGEHPSETLRRVH